MARPKYITEIVNIKEVKNNPNNPRLIKDDKFKKIFNLIDKRYRTGKACIITTNLNYSKDIKENELAIKFKDEFGNDRISNRIS